MDLNNAPYGAITSFEFFKHIVHLAKVERCSFTVYYAYGLGRQSCISEKVITPQTQLKLVQETLSLLNAPRRVWFVMDSPESVLGWSLGDCNVIDGGHNNHFLFVEKEAAEDYISFVKSDKELCDIEERRQQQIREFWNDIDDDWDDYYDD